MFDDRLKRFRRNQDYDLCNVEYDSTSNYVKSSWFGGGCSGANKSKYRIEGDKLVLDSEINLELENDCKMAMVQIINYSTKSKHTKKKRGSSARMWKVFSKTLWNSDSWCPN